MKNLLILFTILTSSVVFGQDKVFEASCETETVKFERYDIFIEGGDRIIVMQFDSFGGKIAERNLALDSNYIRGNKNIIKVYGQNGYTLVLDMSTHADLNATFKVGNSTPVAARCEVE